MIVSSAEVYGAVGLADLPVREDHPLAPVSPYAASKAAAEFLGLQAWLGYSLEVIRTRAFNHVGIGQSDQFVVSGVARQVALAEQDGAEAVVRVGNLSARRDVSDVRDVVRAYRALMVDGVPGAVYNVCSGVDVGIDELVDRLVSLARRRIDVVVDPARVRPVDVPVLRGDPSALVAATRWSPRHGLDATLGAVLDDWRFRLRA